MVEIQLALEKAPLIAEEKRILSGSQDIIGLAGFEPAASCTRGRRSTKLSHSPNCSHDQTRATIYFAYYVDGGKIE